MARDYASYLEKGAQVVSVVIDTPSYNAAMVKKLALPFPVLSDPEGTLMIKPFDLWDGKGQMSKPATLALAPDGREIYRYVGVDLVDRPVYEEALAAVNRLALPPIAKSVATAPSVDPEPGPRALTIRELSLYMRGVRSSTNELSERLHDGWDRSECARTAMMAERFISALAETERTVGRKSG